jgi:hypothetical protein
MPKSYATIAVRRPGSRRTVSHVTSATRSMPSVPGLGSGRGAAIASSAVPNAPAIAPVSRSDSVNRRVSIPAMPLIPCR